MVEKCKNKKWYYENLIQILGTFFIINLVYLMVKSNQNKFAKGVNHETLGRMNLKIL